MQRIAGTLAKAGFKVTLVGRSLPNSTPLTKQDFQQHRITCHFHKGPLFYLEYTIRLLFWLLGHRHDILGTIDADTAIAGIVASWWQKIPMVYDAHELFPEMPEVVHRPLVRKVWAALEKWAFKRASLRYTVSASLVQYFQETYQVPVHLIRNVPFRQEQIIPTKPVPYFIYQGALNEGRGLECTLEAMQNIPATLVICGEGPLKPKLQELATKLGVGEKVVFKGNVPPPQLAELTKNAWAGIMLLENRGLSYYYSLANKFFDYVQAGIPQVCVPFPEYQLLNTQHEVALLASTNVMEVRQAMLTLLHDHETYQRLQQNCLLAAQEWNWEQEGTHLVMLYQ